MSEDWRWVDVGSADEWRDGEGRALRIGARRLVVWRLGERFYALKEACPHAGVSLQRGALAEGAVACPAHGWRFRLSDGACVRGDPQRPAVSYPVRVRAGRIEIGV
ncbi:MAG: Rieske (2Fe-2S) protein [Planctomycetota bacterium]|nr:Rieske (2Fe-2S) protein [Planctomycetota bacterium]MCX8040560.1 Rieske (2Fe-2S) protein [Planctomycetota bacterium]MDW8372180.1 Rieske (2Fe-2S) protein [Planctomycetota bacterium]